MQKMPHTVSINQTQNAMYHQQVAEEVYAHRKDMDQFYQAKMRTAVRKNLEQVEKDKLREEKQMVSNRLI